MSQNGSLVDWFNQLAPSELTDFPLFDTLMETHFHKIRYLYYITCEVSDDIKEKISNIYCQSTDTSIDLIVEFEETEDYDAYLEAVTECRENMEYDEESYFTLRLIFDLENGKTLNISIENHKISGEEEIYENRFNTDEEVHSN